MPVEKVIKSFDSFKYCEVYMVTEWKDDSIYKTKRLGFIEAKDADKLPYWCRATSISTSLTRRHPEFKITILSLAELFSMVDNSKEKAREL